MKFLRAILVFVCVMTLAFAGQTGKIAGRVTDSQSGEALIGCNVIVQGTSAGASTDENGEYFIINLPPGSYDLKFSMIGYAEFTATGVTVNIDVTTPINAGLTSQALEMAGVTVTAQKPAIEQTLTSSKQVVSADVFVNQGISDVQDAVSTLPGVATVGEGELHLRGGRAGEETYLVDGASTNNALFSGNAIPLNPSSIQEMELVTGTFNAEYGQAMSGVFNVVLKEPTEGFHADIAYRTSTGGLDHFLPDGNAGYYAEFDELANSDKTNIGTVSATEFGDDPFTLLDFGASYGAGPLGLMLSVRNYNDPGRLPGLDDAYTNLTSKLVYQVGTNLKVSAELMTLSREKAYDPMYDPMKVDGDAGKLLMFNWKYAMGQYPRTEENNLQFGVNVNYALSASSYINIHVDQLTRKQEDGAKDNSGNFVDFVDNPNVTDNTTYSVKPNHTATWAVITSVDETFSTVFDPDDPNADADGFVHTSTGFDTSYGNAWYDSENVYGHYFNLQESSTNLNASWVNQINTRHQLKVGFNGSFYNVRRDGVDVWYGRTVGVEEDATLIQNQDIPDVKPSDIGFYAQDRMEFSDMVVNVGFRLDTFNPNVSDGKFEGPEAFDMSKREAATTKTTFSPRIGVSHPVGDNLAFRYAYGTFVQRPTFYDLYENYLIQGDGGTESGYFVYIGNPDLDPQETTIYEMGMQYAPIPGFKLDLTGFYKDISNLTAAQEFTIGGHTDTNAGTYMGDNRPFTYTGAHYIGKTSKHFGSVKGFETSLSKSSGALTGRASYTFSVAKGTSSDRVNQGSGSFSETRGGWGSNIMYMNTLSFSRPHIVNGYVDYRMNMGGLNLGTNLSFNYQSGLPYSTYAAAQFAFNKRAPATLDVTLKVDAKLAVGPVSPTVFVQVDNLLNRENVVAIADPSSYFDENESNYQNAAGPRNNLAAYGAPMIIHLGFSIGL
ncbi:MAG: TonB-dependent receptor [Candidatus Marinimicrobia bacterium]|nr:TonB-dependent receptor [Candidatus Neomarinimicrobiota bacterium]MDP6594271.1 TonB-dependent receptor [Candidatus Neomarinimicrobiota bacterium]MDP6836690.1 TonB-dependent receptor [Candidatus Neomarinimicrobiota bacterium]MDP6965697.1 TonB-dependent receptor [Candidatus Neomarinimicrobiota bacterium]